MLSPLDDLPIHQTNEPVLFVSTSDRNFYDRYYFNLFAKDRELFLTAGLGQYPNLGVSDAFVAVTTGGRQYVTRASRELGIDRSDTRVGPIAVEVIEGLKRLRLRAEPSDGDVELDVTWTPSIPAFLEAHHLNRRGARRITDTSRFAQTGFWSGTLRVGDETFEVDPATWWGGRDRSWGIRPVGEPEPVVRRASGGPGGFLWLYCTMQFADFTIVCILQEDRTGRRSLEQAVKVWRDPERDAEHFVAVEHELQLAPRSRRLEGMRLTLVPRAGDEVVVDARPFGASYLSLGTGYGMDDEWRHGMYQGPLVVQHRTYDLGDPDVERATYGLVDNVAEYTLGDEVGFGLLENAVLGPNDRYGLGGR